MVYGDLKNGFGNLEEDMNLVQFFRGVLDRRDSLEQRDIWLTQKVLIRRAEQIIKVEEHT